MNPILAKLISRHGIGSDPAKLKVLMDMPPPKTNRELQSFLGIVNYLRKFSSMTVEVCGPLQRLTSFRAEWTWNRTFSWSIGKSQITSNRRHRQEILWYQEATTPGNWCIMSRPGCCPIPSKGQLKLQIWQSTRQCNVPANHICQKEPIWLRVMIQ